MEINEGTKEPVPEKEFLRKNEMRGGESKEKYFKREVLRRS